MHDHNLWLKLYGRVQICIAPQIIHASNFASGGCKIQVRPAAISLIIPFYPPRPNSALPLHDSHRAEKREIPLSPSPDKDFHFREGQKQQHIDMKFTIVQFGRSRKEERIARPSFLEPGLREIIWAYFAACLQGLQLSKKNLPKALFFPWETNK